MLENNTGPNSYGLCTQLTHIQIMLTSSMCMDPFVTMLCDRVRANLNSNDAVGSVVLYLMMPTPSKHPSRLPIGNRDWMFRRGCHHQARGTTPGRHLRWVRWASPLPPLALSGTMSGGQHPKNKSPFSQTPSGGPKKKLEHHCHRVIYFIAFYQKYIEQKSDRPSDT